MKYIIAVLFLLPFCAKAQDCGLKKEVDPYTKEQKLSTGFMTFNKASLSIDANNREIDFFFSLENAGDTKCFDDASTATIVFDDKRKLIIRNTGTMNCEGYFHITFKNTPATVSALKQLSTKKVASITFTNSSKSVTVVTLSEEKKQLLMDKASCTTEEAKTLIR